MKANLAPVHKTSAECGANVTDTELGSTFLKFKSITARYI